MRVQLDARSLTLGCVVAVLLGALAVTLVNPPVAEGQQISLDVLACKKLEPRSQDFFFDLRFSQCGTQFTTKDAYVGMVAHLKNVFEYTQVAVEVADPDQMVVWKRDQTWAPTAGRYFPNIWIWVVLPVSADVPALAAENVRLTASMVRLEGKPVVERLGDWTMRARADRAGTRTLKFTLQAGQ